MPFLDNNYLWRIMRDVRWFDEDPDEGLRRIWMMLHRAHGSLAVVDKELVFYPKYGDWINYTNHTSSIIQMSEGSNSGITKYSEMEHRQLQEIALMKRTIDRMNKALKNVDGLEIYWDRMVFHTKIREIEKRYKIIRREYYRIKKECEFLLKMEFRLYDMHRQEWYEKQSEKREEELRKKLVKFL